MGDEFQSRPPMHRPGEAPVRLGQRQRPGLIQRSFGQMDPVGTYPLGQFGIQADQQQTLTTRRRLAQPQRRVVGVRTTEVTEYDAASNRQPRRRFPWSGCALRIGEEQEWRQIRPGATFGTADFGRVAR